MNLEVAFEGKLPAGMPWSSVPIEIAVSMPAEFASFLVPTIKLSPTVPLVAEDPDERVLHEDPAYITFLPLPPSFNRRTVASWKSLAFEIQDWLLEVAVDPRCPERIWGTDLFWMAYLAAFPKFPQGQWQGWDPRINVCNTFGERWTMDACPIGEVAHDNGACTDACPGCGYIREELWGEFERNTSLFYNNGPLVRQEV
ncbi:hypothetical protein EW026_g8185 [Hermanssonia centrifuga]|uniref:Uncharacterized protein n=1 Tax=Hermanssonia centrifuga TaxID=98765 RepID=A0A4S4K561_9APHY|nr:hypothetical protein EW026_g8185 [Hermanssonia centrifuga]